MTPELFLVIYFAAGFLVGAGFAAWCGYVGDRGNWPMGIILGMVWPSLLIVVPIFALMWAPFKLGEALRRKP